MYCLYYGHWFNNSKETKTLYIPLFTFPFGLYHVYFLPTYGISCIPVLSINLLNLVISLLLVLPMLTPFLSYIFLTALKSANIHYVLHASVCLISLNSSHIFHFSFNSHVENTFITTIMISFSLFLPIKTMYPLLIKCLSQENTLLCHIVSIPLAPYITSLCI